MKREKKKRNCGCVASRGRERERETELLRTELDMSESRYTDLITQRTSQANCCPCACMQMRGHHGLALPQTETSSMAGRNRKKTKQKIRKNGQEKGFSNHRKQVRQSGNVQTDEKERERDSIERSAKYGCYRTTSGLGGIPFRSSFFSSGDRLTRRQKVNHVVMDWNDIGSKWKLENDVTLVKPWCKSTTLM